MASLPEGILAASSSRYRFGIFEVDPTSGELFRKGLRVRVQEQPFQVLLALLEQPGAVVTRELLRDRLWPDTNVDYDRGLNKAVNRLRSVLGDDADNPRFIETLPQRGYRFLAAVETLSTHSADIAAAPEAALPGSVQAGGPVTGLPSIQDQPLRSLPRRRILALAGAAASIPALVVASRACRPAPPVVRSLAVLPLESLSGDPEQEYFSDGMTDELISEVARIRSLRVISRTSVMRYKDQGRKTLPEIAEELGVDVILEGTIAHSEGTVRINVQLVRAADDRHLWSGRYEHALTRILTLQNEVARAVAREIRLTLDPSSNAALARQRSVQPESYDAYLQAGYLMKRGLLSLGKSIDKYNQAIRLDPEFPNAWAGLAEALVFAAIFGLRRSSEAFPEARKAALRALSLDEANAAAYNALADVKKGFDWNLAGAETEYRHAIALEPNHILAHLWYSECLARLNRESEALAECDLVHQLDPVSPIARNHRAMILFRFRRFAESIRAGNQSVDLDPHVLNAYWWVGMSYAGLRDFSSSLQTLAKASDLGGGPIFIALLGHVHGLAGNRAKALQALGELRGLEQAGRLVSPMDFAILHAGLGDADTVFRWLEKACAERAARMHELASSYFDGLRTDPRYNDLIVRTGLPPVRL